MGLVGSRYGIRPARHERLLKTRKRPLRLQAGGIHVLAQVINVSLHVAELKRLHTGYSHAGTDVTHEVENTGRIAHALARHGIIGDGRQGHENQA